MATAEWTKLTLEGRSADVPLLSAVLSMLDEGLLIEDLSDLTADSPYGEVLSEELASADRETARVSVFLPADRSLAEATAFVRERLREGGLTATLTVDGIREEDWAENWKRYYHPIPFGRLTVVPAWEEYTPREGELILRMDPGTAFGTATHETTHMMIELLDEEIRGGEHVLDVGCGSGILALAARLLGAESAAAYDLDPEAVRVAKKNIADAGLSGVVAEVSDLLSAVPHREGGYDLMAANIVSDILLRLAPAAPPYLKRGGLLAVSGILSARADEVREGIAAAGFTFLREKREGDWVAMLFGRA
ncbi:MAG: 50S ribosomal protein L11 methyltransferase [Clostridia bacterium]|nr:50S ribosomal protein L11 methyltransferase [Clostridia bacterium]